jgi:MarR family transcriptional regulator, lower aerobic nicotinate degradation pathway regulator
VDSSDGFVLEAHVGFLLRRAYQRHAAIFGEAVAEYGLTPTQFAALLKTAELGRVTQNRLGRLVAMDPATIQGVVRRLTERGLLTRTEDPLDKRTAVLAPTEAGLAVLAAIVPCAQRAHAAALSPLTANEQVLFLSLLRKMV